MYKGCLSLPKYEKMMIFISRLCIENLFSRVASRHPRFEIYNYYFKVLLQDNRKQSYTGRYKFSVSIMFSDEITTDFPHY